MKLRYESFSGDVSRRKSKSTYTADQIKTLGAVM